LYVFVVLNLFSTVSRVIPLLFVSSLPVGLCFFYPQERC
jgi:hypothetical protein